MGQLDEALASINLKIIKYDQSKQRPVATSKGTMTVEKFCQAMIKDLGRFSTKYPEVWDALHNDEGAVEEMLVEHAQSKGVLRGVKVAIPIPPDMEGVTLNMNLAAKGKDDRFFLTHEDETVARVSGETYLLVHQLGPLEAAAAARKVIPDYMPRGKAGVTEMDNDGKKETIFNVYTPPSWKKYPNPKKLPDVLPPLFSKLVNHLFPLEVEREYFYSWLHDSLFKRSFVFLILCSSPGTGKNRLKLVMRALHGHVNTTDGKKSTLVERFNSQLSESTLAWFDELHYDAEMENTMKELQNDSISIERKGVDATRATRIHSSIVISNNKPRDNYIAFDARKFVPLVMTGRRLEVAMTPDEIDELTKKVEDPKAETFDTEFLAQIARWVRRRGRSKKWPTLEYRGPMYWSLAHTSMTRWQKKAVMMVLGADGNQKAGYDPGKGAFLWSMVQSRTERKNGERTLQFPDFTSIKAFFEVFRDSKGRKAFETEAVPKNILGDFYVKPLFKQVEIVTEASISEQRGKQNAKIKKEKYDL